MTIARALCLVFAVTGCASSPSVLVALRGEWKGALEYKDYQRPDRRVTLPTDLVATAEGEASVLSFTYDDGPGKTVRGQQRLAFEEGGQVLRWGDAEKPVAEHQRFRVIERTASTLVAETDGEDDDRPALLRETLTLSTDQLTVLKEVQPTGGTLGFRHQYRFTRVR